MSTHQHVHVCDMSPIMIFLLFISCIGYSLNDIFFGFGLDRVAESFYISGSGRIVRG